MCNYHGTHYFCIPLYIKSKLETQYFNLFRKKKKTYLISKSCISSKVRVCVTSSRCFMFSSLFNLPLLAPSCTFDTKSLSFFSNIVATFVWSRLTEGCCTTIVACCGFLVFAKCTGSNGLVVTLMGDVQVCSKWAPTCGQSRRFGWEDESRYSELRIYNFYLWECIFVGVDRQITT